MVREAVPLIVWRLPYFVKIQYNLINKVKSVNIDASFYLVKKSLNTFFMSPIISKDIESVIKNLKNSNGIHNVSTVVLKEVMTEIREPLSFIFNLCTNQGHFSVELKSKRWTQQYWEL